MMHLGKELKKKKKKKKKLTNLKKKKKILKNPSQNKLFEPYININLPILDSTIHKH